MDEGTYLFVPYQLSPVIFLSGVKGSWSMKLNSYPSAVGHETFLHTHNMCVMCCLRTEVTYLIIFLTAAYGIMCVPP